MIVPVQMGQKEKFVQMLEGDPLADKPIQISLPIISYSLKGMKYGTSRKSQSTLMNYNYSNGGLNTQYNPVPYDFDFDVYIYVRNIEDGTQIIENILPFFTPDYTLRIQLSPAMNIIKDVPITLNSVDYEVDNEGDKRSETRKVIWTLNFIAQGWIFGPANIDTNGYITDVITNIYETTAVEGKNINLVVDLSGTGNGNFQQGEIIYQGNTLQTATATATVLEWSLLTGRLSIINATGGFKTNQYIFGLNTHASYLPINYEIY